MNAEMVMQELEALGKERTRKMYSANGAHEPLFWRGDRGNEADLQENQNQSAPGGTAVCHRELRRHVFCRHHCRVPMP